jgi:LAO/AO transport system kinase
VAKQLSDTRPNRAAKPDGPAPLRRERDSSARNATPESTTSETERLAEGVIASDVRVLGRVLSMVDDRNPAARPLLKRLFNRTGRAHIVGITGSAGTGKSSLIACLTTELRQRKKTVGILTVDPTSPFSGGALLGDRIRMREHFLDRGVFIRSLATRGSHGGLSHSAYEAAQVLDAAGNDYILIETIGVGQDQIDIRHVASTVVLVVAPESGDEIQAMKAGTMEAFDVLVINKADLPGAEELFLNLHGAFGDRHVPMIKTSTVTNAGVPALLDEIERHQATDAAARQRDIDGSRRQLLALLEEGVIRKLNEKVGSGPIESWARKIAERESDPYTAAEAILESLKF